LGIRFVQLRVAYQDNYVVIRQQAQSYSWYSLIGAVGGVIALFDYGEIVLFFFIKQLSHRCGFFRRRAQYETMDARGEKTPITRELVSRTLVDPPF
jgi:hypothetical protein